MVSSIKFPSPPMMRDSCAIMLRNTVPGAALISISCEISTVRSAIFICEFPTQGVCWRLPLRDRIVTLLKSNVKGPNKKTEACGNAPVSLVGQAMPDEWIFSICVRLSLTYRLIQEPNQFATAARLLQLTDRLGFDLADALAGHFENVTDFFQRVAVAVAQAIAE